MGLLLLGFDHRNCTHFLSLVSREMAPLHTCCAVCGKRISVPVNTISSGGVSYIACVMVECSTTFFERRCGETCIDTASSYVVLKFKVLGRLSRVCVSTKSNTCSFVNGAAQCSPNSFASVPNKIAIELEVLCLVDAHTYCSPADKGTVRDLDIV